MKLFEKLIEQSRSVENMKEKLSKHFGNLKIFMKEDSSGNWNIRISNNSSYSSNIIDISMNDWKKLKDFIDEMLNKETEENKY